MAEDLGAQQERTNTAAQGKCRGGKGLWCWARLWGALRRWTPMRRGASHTQLQRAAVGRAVCRLWLGSAWG